MQTFLPYADFAKSAQCLDYRRLGKQRVECKQILRALGVQVGEQIIKPSGWSNHPAVRMWRGCEIHLLWYALAICAEWQHRGYKDTLHDQFWGSLVVTSATKSEAPPPLWLGNHEFHDSHKSNLIRKLPEHYGPMWPTVPANLPYIWPV
jgi:hypothetical protein